MASIDKTESGWRARWRTPEGASRSKTFTRKTDAQQHLVAVQHRVLEGVYVDASAGNITVSEYVKAWRARQVHRPSTRIGHDSHLARHVTPFLGERRIRDVRPGDIQAWVRHRSDVLAPSTMRTVYRFVAGIFAAAVVDRLIPSSPCVGVKLPKPSSVEVRPLEADEVRRLADVIAPRYRALVTAGASLGMRQGELLGLTVDRVDFLRRTVRIDRQMVSISKQAPRFGPPKTSQSVRTIPAPQVALDALADHLALVGAGQDGLIFTASDGGPVSRNAVGYIWRQAAKKAGLESVVFHQLRHTAASVLIGSGLSVVAVSRYLGHSPAVCLATYSHMFDSDEDRIRQALDGAFESSGVASVSRVGGIGG